MFSQFGCAFTGFVLIAKAWGHTLHTWLNAVLVSSKVIDIRMGNTTAFN